MSITTPSPRPLPSQVEAALTGLPSVEGDRVLYAHLDHEPLALSWPSSARMHIRQLLDQRSGLSIQKGLRRAS